MSPTFSRPFWSDHSEGTAHFSEIQSRSLLSHGWSLDWPITWNSDFSLKRLRTVNKVVVTREKQTYSERRAIIIIKRKWFSHDPSNNSPCGNSGHLLWVLCVSSAAGWNFMEVQTIPSGGGMKSRHALWWGGGKIQNWEIVEISLSPQRVLETPQIFALEKGKKIFWKGKWIGFSVDFSPFFITRILIFFFSLIKKWFKISNRNAILIYNIENF